jgi:hypothetical protein
MSIGATPAAAAAAARLPLCLPVMPGAPALLGMCSVLLALEDA